MRGLPPPQILRTDAVDTTDFTVAGILTAHVLSSGVKGEALLAPYPLLVSYRNRCLARPAWKRTCEAYCERVEAAWPRMPFVWLETEGHDDAVFAITREELVDGR